MKRLFSVLAVGILVFGVVSCSKSAPEPPKLEVNPTSLKEISGPNVTKQDTTVMLSTLANMINIVNGFADGTYNFGAALVNLSNQMGEYNYANGTWTWTWSSAQGSIRVVCTEGSEGYTWEIYINNEKIYNGYVKMDGTYAYWKYWESDSVYASFEWNDDGTNGYIKFRDGDLTAEPIIWFSWTAGSNYIDLTINATSLTSNYKIFIHANNDNSGYADFYENGIKVWHVEWNSSGNITSK